MSIEAEQGEGIGPQPGGFIVIQRSILESPTWRSLRGDQKSVLFSLLLLASWRPSRFYYGAKCIEVDRGELAHSISTIASHAAVSVKVARTTIGRLIDWGFLGIKPGTGVGRMPRVLRILNYSKYQDKPTEAGTRPGTRSGKQRAHTGQTTGTQPAPLEQGNKNNQGNQKEEAPSAQPPRDNPISKHVALRNRLLAAFEEVTGQKYPFSLAPERNGQALKKLVDSEIDARELEELWRLALTLGEKWPGTGDLMTFSSKLADFIRLRAAPTKPVRQLVAPPSPAEHFKKTGYQEIT